MCALMMLNTDLHGGMVERKMTYNQFESNLRNTEATIGELNIDFISHLSICIETSFNAHII